MGSLVVETRLISKLRDFFKEFDFSGATSTRFYNTLYYEAKQGNAQKYVLNYFKLIDSPYVDDVKQKLSSKEFKLLIEDLKKLKEPKNKINKRFKLYYGSQGGGKTYKCMQDNPKAKVMVCNSSFEPGDLIESFHFKDGKPIYKPTALTLAMSLGQKIILDEINLLSKDCLRALQGFLDNKTEIVYKDYIIHINEGFEIIGTMNLEINGQIESLPAPLVDRAYHIEEVVPTNEFIAELALSAE